jgi:Leucine-rich repeat (LRR) protein
MAITTTSAATPLNAREPVLIGFVFIGVLINAAIPQLSEKLSYPDWIEAVHGGFALGQCLMIIMLTGLMARTWLGGYLTAIAISWLLLGVLMVSEMWDYGLDDSDTYMPFLAVPLVLLIGSSATCGLRQFFGVCLARESESAWSRSPLRIGDVFVVIAFAGASLVFARAPLISASTSPEDFWPSLGLAVLVGVGMGLTLVLPAVYFVFVVRARWRMMLGLLGLSLFPTAVVATVAPLLVAPRQRVQEALEATNLFLMVSAAAAVYFLPLLLLLHTRRYRLLRAPYIETPDRPAPSSRADRWIVGVIVLVAVAANFVMSPIEEANWQKQQTTVWVNSVGGSLEEPDEEITVINFEDTAIRDEDLPRLSGLRSLQLLSLDGTAITDAGLGHLKMLPHLRELLLDNTDVSDGGLQHLRHLPNLTSLSLSNTNVAGASLESLESRPKITHLNVSGTAVTDESCRGIAKMTALSEVDLSGTSITDAGLQHLSRLQELTALRLNKTAIRGAAFTEFGKLPKLTFLDVSSTLCGNDLSYLLSRTPQLEVLRLNDTAVSDAGISALRGHANLTELDLSGTSITDRGLGDIHLLLSLRTLVLRKTQLTGEGFKDLIAPQLEALNLQQTSLTDDAIAHLSQFPKLYSLDLSGTAITDRALRHLSGMPLEHLSIIGTQITAKGLLDAGLDVGQIDVESNRFSAEEQRALQLKGTYLYEVVGPPTEVADE